MKKCIPALLLCLLIAGNANTQDLFADSIIQAGKKATTDSDRVDAQIDR